MAIQCHQVRLGENLEHTLLLEILNHRSKMNIESEQEDIQHVVKGLVRRKCTTVCTGTSYISDMLRTKSSELSRRGRAERIARSC